MLGRRMGRGGLLRAAATTAVVAGTATAVSGGIRGRQDAQAQQAAEAQAYEQQQQQAQMDAAAQQAVYAQQAAAPPAPAAAGDDLMAQLQNLATMHSQGILSDDEFAAAKAKLLT
jgi:malonyl CoA-acyl carrier protein transacylase